MKQIIRNFFPALTALMILTAISCNPAKKFEKEERQQIDSYMQTVGDSAFILKPSGLYYYEVKTGTGRTPVVNDTVAFRYRARFLNGTELDNNIGTTTPYYFIVGDYEVIDGIDEGVRYMKPGGKAILITPSALAYGAAGSYPYIPGYTPFRWDIELISVAAGSK